MAEDTSTIGILLKLTGEKETSAGLIKLESMIRKYGESARTAGRHSVSSMQASSAALRALHGGFENNIRAGERFLSMLPGVGKALQAAFPLIGITAVAGAVFEAGKKIYEMGKKAEEAGGKIQQAFQKLHYSAQQSNDELVLSTDKIRDQIAVLEGKPRNGLKDALDEAKVSADKLYASLSKDSNALTTLFKSDHVGIGGLLVNKGSTGDTEDDIKNVFANINTLQRQIIDAQHSGKSPEQINATVADLTSKIAAARDAGIAHFNRQASTLTQEQGFTQYYQPSINEYAGAANVLKDQKYHAQDQKEHDRAEADLKTEQSQKQAAELAKQAAEQQKRAAAKLERASEEFARTINGHSRIHHTAVAQAKTLAKSQAMDDDEFLRQSRIYPMWIQGRAAQNQASIQQSGYKLSGINARYSRQLQAAQIDNAVSTGQISPLAADAAYTQMDTQQFNQEIAALVQQLQDINSVTSGLSLSAKQAQSAKINNQIAQLTGRYNVQHYKDVQAQQKDSPMGMLLNQTRLLAQQFSNLGTAISTVMQSSLFMANQSLASGLTGQGFHGKQLALGVAQNAIGNGLQYAEGKGGLALIHSLSNGHGKLAAMLNKLTGHGKPTGTASDPLYVVAAGGASGGGGSSISSILNGVMGSGSTGIGSVLSSGSQAAASAGGMATTTSTLTDLLPMAGFASGGQVAGGIPILVGEHGREIFTPGKGGGYITPNHQIASNGTSQSTQNITINAQGATDPAATAVAVRNAIHASSRRSIQASLYTQHEAKQRSPMPYRG
jgi:hypothetical protein